MYACSRAGQTFPHSFDNLNVGCCAIVPDHGAGQLYNASYGTPQQTGEPLALWSDRANA
jgi:hypothetical protein